MKKWKNVCLDTIGGTSSWIWKICTLLNHVQEKTLTKFKPDAINIESDVIYSNQNIGSRERVVRAVKTIVRAF